MTTHHTDLGNEVRAEIARILARYQDCDLAGVKMSTIRKIDRLINPEPDTFRIPTERTDARPYLALEQARIDRLLFGEVQ